MAKVNLAAIPEAAIPASDSLFPDYIEPNVTETTPTKLPKSVTSKHRNSSKTSADTGRPLYEQLVRKEARIRADQYAALTTLARQLSAEHSGERITENTLIRLAIENLLTRPQPVTAAEALTANRAR